ncbi:MAG: FAD-dependent oxidoreductase, partial [Gammaproteobacteria bacterium]
MNDCCAVPGGDSKPRAYDLAVIGAGSAGFSAAITAANLGARVALIGHGTIGGTCVNIGCVPSKTLLRAAEAVHAAQSVTRFPGLAGTATLTDWSALMAAKDELVVTLRRQKYAELLPGYETIDYIEGQARFADGMLTVGGAPLRADRFVIATGASPALPDVPGIANVPILTSTSALELPERPESLLVIGGGYIGCELAQLFARLGSKVTLVTRSRLLPESEPEVSAALTGYLRDEGITVWAGLSYREI